MLLFVIFGCLIFSTAEVEARVCDALFEDFTRLRDKFVFLDKLITSEDLKGDLENQTLGFSIWDDDRWLELFCDIEDAIPTDSKDTDALVDVLNRHLVMPVNDWMLQEWVNGLYDLYEYTGKELLADFERYQRKMNPWLTMTNFPYEWPIRNAGKRETARLIRLGDEMSVPNVITLGAYVRDYTRWTKRMLRAQTFEDYASIVNAFYDERNVEVQQVACDVMRDTNVYTTYVLGTWQVVLHITEHFYNMGLYNILPEGNYGIYGYYDSYP